MQPRHRSTPFLAVLALLAALPAPAQPAPTMRAQPGTESPGLHGMLVLGSETIYASHLPMFTPEHRYQGIWQVSFGESGNAKYRAERAKPANAGKIFTLAPTESFLLPELTSTRKSFKADVFLGHFERPGKKQILSGVTVTVERPIHWHPFLDSHAQPEPATYLLFGSDEELFLAHWISVAPSYDQILAVKPSAPVGEIPQGAQYVVLKRPDGKPLRAGDSIAGLMVVGRGPEQPALLKAIDLGISSEFYLEKDELEFDDLTVPVPDEPR